MRRTKDLTVNPMKLRRAMALDVNDSLAGLKGKDNTLSALTPAQLMRMFPDYYKREKPDQGLTKQSDRSFPMTWSPGSPRTGSPETAPSSQPRERGPSTTPREPTTPSPPSLLDTLREKTGDKPRQSSVPSADPDNWWKKNLKSQERNEIPSSAMASLEGQRQALFEKLDANPALKRKFFAIAANEQGTHPEGIRAVMESLMNRAIIRGGGVEGGLKRLEKEIRWTSERGYYEDVRGQQRAWNTINDPKNTELFEKAYNDVRRGSNVSNFGYGNASAGTAQDKITGRRGIRADPTKEINGETFFGPNSDEPGYIKNYSIWKRQLQEGGPNKPPLYVGDSVAHGLSKARGTTTEFTEVGLSSRKILEKIKGIDVSKLKGQTVVLSSGLLNSPQDEASVRDAIRYLKNSGANVRLVGGPTDDPKKGLEKVNESLERLAREESVEFLGGFKTKGKRGGRGDGVHPSDYSELDSRVRTETRGGDNFREQPMSDYPAQLPDGLSKEVVAYYTNLPRDKQFEFKEAFRGHKPEEINKAHEEAVREQARRTSNPDSVTRLPQQYSRPAENIADVYKMGSRIGGIQGYDSFKGLCGKGVRGLAGALLNDSYFSRGLGTRGSPNAGSLAIDNDYLQRSGYFNQRQGLTKDQIASKEYLDSLPVGAVIVSHNDGRGPGHIQIKVASGQWVSDNRQGNKILEKGTGGPFSTYVLVTPNEEGIKRLGKFVVNDPATMAYVQQQGYNISPVQQQAAHPVSPAAPTKPEDYDSYHPLVRKHIESLPATQQQEVFEQIAKIKKEGGDVNQAFDTFIKRSETPEKTAEAVVKAVQNQPAGQIVKYGVGVVDGKPIPQQEIIERDWNAKGTVKFNIPGMEHISFAARSGGTKASVPQGTYTLNGQPVGSTIRQYYERSGLSPTGEFSRVWNVGTPRNKTGIGYDPRAGYSRSEIQFHAYPIEAQLSRLKSSGCIVMKPSEYKEFVRTMQKAEEVYGKGNLALRVTRNEDGTFNYQITPSSGNPSAVTPEQAIRETREQQAPNGPPPIIPLNEKSKTPETPVAEPSPTTGQPSVQTPAGPPPIIPLNKTSETPAAPVPTPTPTPTPSVPITPAAPVPTPAAPAQPETPQPEQQRAIRPDLPEVKSTTPPKPPNPDLIPKQHEPVDAFAHGGKKQTKGDNATVVSDTGKPIFRMNTERERAVYEPGSNQINVQPVERTDVSKLKMEKISSKRKEMDSRPAPTPSEPQRIEQPSSDPNYSRTSAMADISNMVAHNPSMNRANQMRQFSVPSGHFNMNSGNIGSLRRR